MLSEEKEKVLFILNMYETLPKHENSGHKIWLLEHNTIANILRAKICFELMLSTIFYIYFDFIGVSTI